MIAIRTTNCCGLREISSLSQYNRNARKAVTDILLNSTWTDHDMRGRPLKTRNPYRFGMFLFTQASSEENPAYPQSYGDQLKRMVEKLKLGTVTVTAPFQNPNTSNYIRTYTWAVDWGRAMDFLHEELRKRESK